mgnify:FL=1
MNIGVIGTGAIGQDHIRRITHRLTGGKVVAVSDADPDRAHQVVSDLRLDAKVYANGHDLIRADEVDAVMVTTWGETHEEYVIASIAAGKPVFCEKPLATTAESCRRIVEAELACGKHLVQVGYMRRYDQGYRALKKVLDDGVIGEPLMVHCMHRNPTAPGFKGDMPITDSFVHEIDVLRWLLEDDYVSVQVILPRKTRFAPEDVQDPHIILLETAKGIRIVAEVFVFAQYGYDIQCQVVGEKGIANLPEPAGVVLRKNAKCSVDILMNWKDRFIDAYDVELQDWIRSASRGEMNGPSAWDGYVQAITADACLEAKRTGGIVSIHIPECPEFYKR